MYSTLRCAAAALALLAALCSPAQAQQLGFLQTYPDGTSFLDGPPAGLPYVAVTSDLSGETADPVVQAAAHPLVVHSPASHRPQAQRTGSSMESFGWQVLPAGIIYPSYLAGAKESRMAGKIVKGTRDNWLLDATLGSRFGVVRYGTFDPFRPQGFQIDIEGSAQLRLDMGDEMDVRATDYRAGVPLTWAHGRHHTKLAYYHLSSHLGDEFLLKNPGFNRLNFARDALVLGHGVYLNDDVRVYGEVAWAFYSIIAEEWEFQFGLDYAPSTPTGPHGAPFFAINAHLREEVDFGGTLTVHTGWAWRSAENASLFRLGVHYLNGESNHWSFFDRFEQQIGIGIWLDR